MSLSCSRDITCIKTHRPNNSCLIYNLLVHLYWEIMPPKVFIKELKFVSAYN